MKQKIFKKILKVELKIYRVEDSIIDNPYSLF